MSYLNSFPPKPQLFSDLSGLLTWIRGLDYCSPDVDQYPLSPICDGFEGVAALLANTWEEYYFFVANGFPNMLDFL
jgi:hypothetical protein